MKLIQTKCFSCGKSIAIQIECGPDGPIYPIDLCDSCIEKRRNAAIMPHEQMIAAERLARRVVDGIHVDDENISELRALARIVLGCAFLGDFDLLGR